jgi:hypothetical protein
MSAWTNLVSQMYKKNKGKPGYKLKNAMKDAKKIYKPMGKTMKPCKSRKSRKSRKTRRH